MLKKVVLILLFGIYTYLNAYEACLVNGHYFEDEKKYDKAFKAYLDGANRDVVDCMMEAAKFYTNEDYGVVYQAEKAQALLLRALKIEPYNSLLHYNLGIHYFKEDNNSESRYHFLFAYLLGDKDAVKYLKQIVSTKKNGYISEVVSDKKFDVKLIAQRLIHFSNNTFKEYKSKYDEKDKEYIIINTPHKFSISIYPDEIKLYGYLKASNAKLFGVYIRLIQRAVYVDIPKNILDETNNKLDELMSKVVLKGDSEIKSEFTKVLKHKFVFRGNSKYLEYSLNP